MKKKIALLGLASLVVAGVAFVGTASVASGLGNQSHSTSVGAPVYSTNSSGQTYGSVANAKTPADQPTLALVDTDQGGTGYVYLAELSPVLKSPEEVAQYQAKVEANGGRLVLQAFASDGKTQVGTFTLTAGSAVEGK